MTKRVPVPAAAIFWAVAIFGLVLYPVEAHANVFVSIAKSAIKCLSRNTDELASGVSKLGGKTARIQAGHLPDEAQKTIQRIKTNGPFPFGKDGLEFKNHEGRLPFRPSGHYREYTVPTPGHPNRGAQRIISGRNGELFYTDDHYITFKQID